MEITIVVLIIFFYMILVGILTLYLLEREIRKSHKEDLKKVEEEILKILKEK